MGRKTNRLLILVLACSTAGVVVGGTAGWAESNQCVYDLNPTDECLTKSPILNTLEGMSAGLVAGAGAAAGAAWQLRHEE